MPGIVMKKNIISTVPTNGLGIGSESIELADIFDTTTDGITATAGGTQGTSVLLVSRMNRITTVASAGDGVRLPPAIAGMKIEVRNAAAVNAANVFPSSATQGGAAGGDQINALGQNNPLSLTVAANTVTFRCYTTGTWFTL